MPRRARSRAQSAIEHGFEKRARALAGGQRPLRRELLPARGRGRGRHGQRAALAPSGRRREARGAAGRPRRGAPAARRARGGRARRAGPLRDPPRAAQEALPRDAARRQRAGKARWARGSGRRSGRPGSCGRSCSAPRASRAARRSAESVRSAGARGPPNGYGRPWVACAQGYGAEAQLRAAASRSRAARLECRRRSR